MKSALLNTQFPPIPPADAQQWLIEQGFTESTPTAKDIVFELGRGQKGKGRVSKFTKEQYDVFLNLDNGAWTYHNRKSHFGDEGTRPRDLIAKVKNALRLKKAPPAPVLSTWEETQANQGVYYDSSKELKGTYRFIVYFGPKGGNVEEDSNEIDVDATDRSAAFKLAYLALAEDYETGMEIYELKVM